MSAGVVTTTLLDRFTWRSSRKFWQAYNNGRAARARGDRRRVKYWSRIRKQWYRKMGGAL